MRILTSLALIWVLIIGGIFAVIRGGAWILDAIDKRRRVKTERARLGL